MVRKKVEIKWSSEPDEHNYLAAKSYLSLIYGESVANGYVEKLRRSSISEFKAKIFSEHPVCRCLGSATRTSKKMNRK